MTSPEMRWCSRYAILLDPEKSGMVLRKIRLRKCEKRDTSTIAKLLLYGKNRDPEKVGITSFLGSKIMDVTSLVTKCQIEKLCICCLSECFPTRQNLVGKRLVIMRKGRKWFRRSQANELLTYIKGSYDLERNSKVSS